MDINEIFKVKEKSWNFYQYKICELYADLFCRPEIALMYVVKSQSLILNHIFELNAT